MADRSPIEWLLGPDGEAGATWNPVTGCDLESPGCRFCYAMTLAGGRMKNHPSRAGLTIDTKKGPVWNGQVRFNAEWLDQPLKWKRPRSIFVVAHGDLFYINVHRSWRDLIWSVIMRARHHRLIILTKRPWDMWEYIYNVPGRVASGEFAGEIDGPVEFPLRHVILGCSVEDQRRANERHEPMKRLATMGWRTWVSYEPALEPVDWTNWGFLDWMISGGESGPHARPSPSLCHTRARDYCRLHEIPFLFKQWGAWIPASQTTGDQAALGGDVVEDGGQHFFKLGKKAAGRLLDGIEHNGLPA